MKGDKHSFRVRILIDEYRCLAKLIISFKPMCCSVVNGALEYLSKDLGIAENAVLQGTMIASSLMDKQGRKSLLITSFSGMERTILEHN